MRLQLKDYNNQFNVASVKHLYVVCLRLYTFYLMVFHIINADILRVAEYFSEP